MFSRYEFLQNDEAPSQLIINRKHIFKKEKKMKEQHAKKNNNKQTDIRITQLFLKCNNSLIK